jgi:hypothetical protein
VVVLYSSSVFDLVFYDRMFPSPSELFVCVRREQDALYLMRSI